MAKMITLDEMLGVIVEQGWPGAHAFKQIAEGLATAMADLIADKTGSTHGKAEFWDGGTMAAFRPVKAGDAMPDVLAHLDGEGDWLTEEQMTRDNVPL